MPRWKALSDELDPQVREFAGQLRRLVDRRGLSVAAVADRAACSRTSWERYLNGRQLAPKGAVVALAEAAGTSQAHLATMWELAERAWSRSEPRQDVTVLNVNSPGAQRGDTAPWPGHGPLRRRPETVGRAPRGCGRRPAGAGRGAAADRAGALTAGRTGAATRLPPGRRLRSDRGG
ncbi:helix-turn-helix domain-containing protein [Streptomyces sp. NPDC001933]|uniref:helix-turn-helix domain-containing protein n=1 Tax=Streptomyces sp. NPDC001933 TaxID=3364626 RepID=UPI003674A499